MCYKIKLDNTTINYHKANDSFDMADVDVKTLLQLRNIIMMMQREGYTKVKIDYEEA